MNQKADTMPPQDKQTGARIKLRRRELGMTQKELATAANLTTAAISQFESGVRTPSCRTLCSLSDALKVTTDWLLGRALRSYDDILADPEISTMFPGILALPKADKRALSAFYHFLKNRSETATDEE